MKLHGLSFKPTHDFNDCSLEEWEEIIETEERLCDSIRSLFPLPDDIDERNKVLKQIETLKKIYDCFNIDSIVIAAKYSYEKDGRVVSYDDEGVGKHNKMKMKMTTI